MSKFDIREIEVIIKFFRRNDGGFTPIFGAIMADSFLGKFRTIFYVSIVYAIGQVVLTVGAIGDSEEGIPGLPATYVNYNRLISTVKRFKAPEPFLPHVL